ncbi:hypothetical protein [Thorsellia kenyensis]|uniref:Pyridoxamine 5'-phosphate oxidase putative domain-containing protein n=1 Tax=Thorsellia kenyensis TaxID=1549888 RepID=A0ABV6C9I8_9GAMM
MTQLIDSTELINEFLKKQFILSITCQAKTNEDKETALWSANCFYVTSNKRWEKTPLENPILDLYFMSSMKTQHAKMLLSNPFVSGTIASSTREVKDIEGIQYLAKALCINETEKRYQELLAQYQFEFPEAKRLVQPLWQLAFYRIKYTRNSPNFGEKFLWTR